MIKYLRKKKEIEISRDFKNLAKERKRKERKESKKQKKKQKSKTKLGGQNQRNKCKRKCKVLKYKKNNKIPARMLTNKDKTHFLHCILDKRKKKKK